MIKVLRLLMIILIVLGIVLSIVNFISVDNMAGSNKEPAAGEGWRGTQQPDGCYGEPLNC